MASKRRAPRRAPVIQEAVEEEEDFTSGDQFDFGGVPSPRLTRARRASMSFEPSTRPSRRASLAPALAGVQELPPKTSSRRRSLAPLVMPPKPAGRRRSVAPEPPRKPVARKTVVRKAAREEAEEDTEEFIFDPRPSRGLTPGKAAALAQGIQPGSFYSSPARPVPALAAAASLPPSPTKSSVTASPTKRFSKTTTRVLTEDDITASLMAEFDQTPTDAKKPVKTFETAIPAEKVKPRRREVLIKSPVVLKAFKTHSPKKTPVKKTKASKLPVKSPPSTPVVSSLLKEIRQVEVRLTPHRIKEDPNVIFSMLEAEHTSEDRVDRVVKALVAKSAEKKPKTRNISMETPKLVTKTVKKTIVPPVETPKAEDEVKEVAATPRGRGRPPKAKAAKTPTVTKKTLKTPVAEKMVFKTAPKTPVAEKKTAKTPVAEKKTEKKTVKAPVVVKKASKTPVVEKKAPKTPVIEKKAPKTPVVEKKPAKSPLPAKKVGKTPKTAKKSSTVNVSVDKSTPKVKDVMRKEAEVEKENLSPEVEVRGTKRPLDASTTPASKRMKPSEPSPKPAKKAKTPLVARYKQRGTPRAQDPLSALKKPLKRLGGKASAVTPAQVKPSDVLRRKLSRQVDTAITAKVEQRPDSSPYAMDVTENNSPVFRKVEREAGAVTAHLTGTPARPARARKFGTAMQPSSLALLDASALPVGAGQPVSSSTPLRPQAGSPHPLEAVEATPIRAPSPSAAPTSPQPQMVTGKLEKFCSIM